MATRKPRRPQPLEDGRMRQMEPSERTEQDRAYDRFVERIHREAREILKDTDKQQRFMLVVVRVAQLAPSFAKNLSENLRWTLKAQRPFENFIRKATRKQGPTK